MRIGYCFKVAVHELRSCGFYYPPLPLLPSALDVLFFFFSDFHLVTVSSYLLIVILSVCLSACLPVCLSVCLSASVCLLEPPLCLHAQVISLVCRVNYDFTFEDRMAELGCEVLSFDPR